MTTALPGFTGEAGNYQSTQHYAHGLASPPTVAGPLAPQLAQPAAPIGPPPPPLCPAGTTRCGAACVNLKSDPGSCGSCFHVCPPGPPSSTVTCTSGVCGWRCSAGLTQCGNSCVNLATDPGNCGFCGGRCANPGEDCCSGSCRQLRQDPGNCGSCGNTCAAADQCCNGTCIAVQTDPQNCGSCGHACAPGFVCQNGTCVCPPGQTNCSGSCVKLGSDPDNCGYCGGRCANPGEDCCSGSCQQLRQDPGNCGSCGNACAATDQCCNGTCIAVQSDTQNCGSCGNVCPVPPLASGARASCTNGACGLQCVRYEYTYCAASQTCTYLQTDANNCGRCGNICPAGPPNSSPTCTGGACGYQCDAGSIACGSGCCSSPPNSTPTCASGVCTFTCNPGYTRCGNTCVNLSNDGSNCGRCGNACLPGHICEGGSCICPPPQTDCFGVCKNLNADSQNCGGCNKVCAAGQPCCSGVCKDVTTDPLNCGRCASVCPQSCSGARRCVNGTCQAPGSWPMIAEDPTSRCAAFVGTVAAFSQAEAIGCVQQQHPGYLVGAPAGNFTYQVWCPDPDGEGSSCNTVSNIVSLSQSDGQACVQYGVDSTGTQCGVVPGSC